MPWVCDVSVLLKELADVQGLASPEVSVNGPVERQLQRTPVQRAISAVSTGSNPFGSDTTYATTWVLDIIATPNAGVSRGDGGVFFEEKLAARWASF